MPKMHTTGLIETLGHFPLHGLSVDKSLFIKFFLEDSSHFCVILRPRGFGKTHNLSMVEFFLSRSIDATSRKKAFNGLRIENYTEFVSRKAGCYRVVRLDFQGLAPCGTWKELKIKIMTFLCEVLQSHRDLIWRVRSGDLLLRGLASGFTSDIISDEGLWNVLQDLIQFSEEHVILLVDDYDSPLLYPMDNEEEELLRLKWFTGFHTTLYWCGNVRKGLVTGTIQVKGIGRLMWCGMNETNFAPFFGFTEVEVLELLNSVVSNAKKAREIWERPRGLREMYHGYHFEGGIVMTNPHECIGFIKRGFHASNIVSNGDIVALCDQFPMIVPAILGFPDLLKMRTMTCRAPLSRPIDLLDRDVWLQDTVLRFLFLMGFVTYEKIDRDTGFVRIPNRQMLIGWHRLKKFFGRF